MAAGPLHSLALLDLALSLAVSVAAAALVLVACAPGAAAWQLAGRR